MAKSRGQAAEETACRYLQSQGLILRERNFRCRCGEIDLVMEEAGTLVFVEVRFRSSRRFGSAAESVDSRKQRRIITAANHYLQRHRELGGHPARFDVVYFDAPGRLHWIKDAFRT